jgi:hypothetical protein
MGIYGAKKYIDSYSSDLKSVGRIAALEPSEGQVEAYRRYFSQQFEASFKAAQAKSIFFNLVSRSVILHGTKSINYVKNADGSAKRHELVLQKHGTQVDMPRLELIDPFDLNYMLRVFRLERRTDETDNS